MADQEITIESLYRQGSIGGVRASTPTPLDQPVQSLRRGHVIGSPRIRVAGIEPPPLEVRLFEPDAVTPKALLPGTWERTFQELLNEPGSGSFAIDNWIAEDGEMTINPLLPIIELDDIVRFYVRGECAFAGIIDQIDGQTISSDEEHGEITKVDTIGILSLLSDGLVYPSRGTGVWPIEEDRVFNWTSVDFDDTGWGTAKSMMTVGQAKTEWPYTPFGEGFGDDNAAVLWAPGTSSYTAPEGHCYFRKEFTSGVTTRALFYGLVDNTGEVYLDGQLIMQVTPESGFQGVTTFSIDITAGEHTLAVHGFNFPDDGAPGFNPGGIAISIYAVDQNDEPTSPFPIVHTDESWLCLPYPPGPPGMTPGEVMIHCCNEAISRGCFPALTFAFDEHTDSAGNAWTEYGDIATKVGTDVLTFFREMSATYMDFWLEPSRLRLWAWAKDGRGTVKSEGPTYGENDSSIVELSHQLQR